MAPRDMTQVFQSRSQLYYSHHHRASQSVPRRLEEIRHHEAVFDWVPRALGSVLGPEFMWHCYALTKTISFNIATYKFVFRWHWQC